ncbi:hypothetical protein [Brevibacillus porteri]|uniref:hypothetical protein n=1 Tax=Brevibacillus porteri TaxID=2126350 RepID=UPI003636B0B1
MINVIKEYLVSLGMSVDQKSFDQADKAIETLEEGVKSFASSTVKSFAVAGTAIATTIATANVAIAKFLGNLAQADLENEKFATRMWISKDAAASLNNTLKAMNATIEDLYLSPELLRNFQQLRATINEMKPPPEFQNQMKTIRSIKFEFQRMRLEATYGLQWIGFYLFKYLEGPIKNIKKGFGGLNNAIIKSMPKWTKDIAQFLSWFVRLGIAMAKGGRDILRLFIMLGERVPTSIKLITTALLGLFLAIKAPFIGISLLITGILLLLDDFYTYVEGGNSAFGPLWKKIIDFYKMLKDTGVIDRFGRAFDQVMATIDRWIKRAVDGTESFIQHLNERGYLESLQRSFESTFDVIYKVVKGFADWVFAFFDELNDDGILSGLLKSVLDLSQELIDTIGWVADLVSQFLELDEVQVILEGLSNFISGTLKFALEGIKNTLDSVVATLRLAKAWVSGDDVGIDKALGDFAELKKRQDSFADHYGGKVKDFFNFMVADENAPNPFLSNTTTAGADKQNDRLNASINNLPRGLEPSFKKALNESELIKGFKNYNLDLKNGLTLLAGAINPEVFERYQALSTGTYAGNYMYSTNSNQTIIQNENKATFNITSTDPKSAAQESNQQWSQWSGLNIRNLKSIFG